MNFLGPIACLLFITSMIMICYSSNQISTKGISPDKKNIIVLLIGIVFTLSFFSVMYSMYNTRCSK